jgi:Protein of unknown function (DUF3352)
VAPASSELFLRLRTRSARDWRVLARVFPREAATFERLRPALGPETDMVALDGQTLLALTQPAAPAQLDSLLAKQRPPLVSEEVGDWRVVARTRATIDRLKRARNGGSLAASDTYQEATSELPPGALATFYADGGAVTRALDRGLKTGTGPIPGLGRIEWAAAALTARAGGLAVNVRVKGDEIEAAPYTAELPSQVPSPVTLLVDAKGLDRTLDELKGLPSVATSRNPVVQALRTGILDDAIALFRNEAALYVRQLPDGPEYTLVVKIEDEAAADAVVDRLVTLVGAATQTVPKHQTIAGIDATMIAIGKTRVYYAVFDGKLVATTAPSGIRGLRGTGARLVGTQAWRAAVAAAGLPDQTAGLVYADVQHALPLLQALFGGTPQTPAPPFGRGLLYASVDGSVLTVRGFLSLR